MNDQNQSTPRTDDQVRDYRDNPFVSPDFARQLERELNKANQALAESQQREAGLRWAIAALPHQNLCNTLITHQPTECNCVRGKALTSPTTSVVPWAEVEEAFKECLNIYADSVKFDGEDHYCGCCDMILSNGGGHKHDCILERFMESFSALSKSYAPQQKENQ